MLQQKLSDKECPSEPSVVRAYKPNSLPWRAKRRGTESLVWYVVEDCLGEEMCNTGSMLLEDEPQARAQVMWLLAKVNGSNQVEIDLRTVLVVWD